ncbi:rCG37743 [Rattus norvegicus]|uniref:RCG37743 n=1 Tax=Rattus norvegicus TaxID=10116 RepID=A6JEY3_RAT|nr:rCG37743 [Rattus norvegicus]
MIISPLHHLPAAAASSRSGARGPGGPETGRRAGSRPASQAQLRMDWIASLHVRKPFGFAQTPRCPQTPNPGVPGISPCSQL